MLDLREQVATSPSAAPAVRYPMYGALRTWRGWSRQLVFTPLW